MNKITQKRHIAKTITWRIIATSTTFLLAWIISEDIKVGIKVGIFEFFLKMLLYYMHERAWYKLSFGIIKEKK